MSKESVESLCARAQLAVSKGLNEEARHFYQQALGLSSENPDAHYGLATVLFLLNDLPASAYHFKEVTRIDPRRAGAYVNLGAVYNRLNQLDDALAALRRGIQIDANRSEGYYNLGLVYKRKGQPDMAIQAYREATRLNPRMADAHLNIANIYFERGNFPLAVAHYRLALEVRPNWDKALRGIEHAEAARVGTDAISQEPGTGAEVDSGVSSSSQDTVHEKMPLDPDRIIDPMVHGDKLKSMHRLTIDSDVQGREFLKILELEVEQAIKQLSNVILYPGKPPSEIDACVRKFDAAMKKMRSAEETLRAHIDRVKEIGEQLVQS